MPGGGAASCKCDFVDFGDEAAVRAALREPTALLWIETPSNPLLRITDIAHFAQAGHAAGALVVVDNTFLSPLWQKPLDLGADLVVHSTTKYLNGHSDVVGGAAIAATQALHEQLSWWANCLGLTGRALRQLPHAAGPAHLECTTGSPRPQRRPVG